jgi:hypothetical protein
MYTQLNFSAYMVYLLRVLLLGTTARHDTLLRMTTKGWGICNQDQFGCNSKQLH